MGPITSINDPAYILFGTRKLDTFVQVRTKPLEWRGETTGGEFVLVRYKHGFLAAGMGDTEYEAEDVVVVGTCEDNIFSGSEPDPTIKEVMEFFDWTPVDDGAVFE